MILLALIRHGPTPWNALGRIQGRTDIALGAAGRALVGRWRPPPRIAGADWVCSPLARARETAALLGAADPAIEPRLIEMDWGAWEGQTLAALRAAGGSALAENEARGLDFRPEGGESPRQVQDRLRPWLAEVAQAARPTTAVTHKGVIRALFALATGWDMIAPQRPKLDWSAVHLFRIDAGGAPHCETLNLPMERA